MTSVIAAAGRRQAFAIAASKHYVPAKRWDIRKSFARSRWSTRFHKPHIVTVVAGPGTISEYCCSSWMAENIIATVTDSVHLENLNFPYSDSGTTGRLRLGMEVHWRSTARYYRGASIMNWWITKIKFIRFVSTRFKFLALLRRASANEARVILIKPGRADDTVGLGSHYSVYNQFSTQKERNALYSRLLQIWLMPLEPMYCLIFSMLLISYAVTSSWN